MKPFFRFSLFFLILCCVSFSGCRKTAEKAPPKTGSFILGFSQIGSESAWRKRNTRSIQEAAAETGTQLLFFNAEQKQENQIKAIRSFIAYQVDVIAFVPIISTGWRHVLEEARDAGIPVLICDREIDIRDENLYAGYIGNNSVQQGRNAAEFLIKKFTPEDTDEPSKETKSPSPHPVRIVELSGTTGSSVAIKRAQGFRDVLAEHKLETTFPQFEIIYSESGDFLKSKGYELMSRILDTFDNINVIYSHNDSMTLGAIDALKERGIQPGADIVIVTIDAEQAAIDALKRGEVNCVIECNPMLGREIMKFAGSLARGEAIPRILFMSEKVFSEFDDLSKIQPRGY